MARSALSLLLSPCGSDLPWGRMPIVKRYIKGVFEQKPVLPKVYTIWDVRDVFDYIRSLPTPQELTLKVLSHNLALLLGLLSGGQRCQTIHQIQVPDISIANGLVSIPVMEKIKQTRPGKHMEPLRFRLYDQNDRLCIVTLFSVYLDVTKVNCTSPRLFLSYVRPHSAVGKDTIARWCKCVLRDAGIDIERFSSHSSRAATSSRAKSKGMALDKIIAFAGW